ELKTEVLSKWRQQVPAECVAVFFGLTFHALPHLAESCFQDQEFFKGELLAGLFFFEKRFGKVELGERSKFVLPMIGLPDPIRNELWNGNFRLRQCPAN